MLTRPYPIVAIMMAVLILHVPTFAQQCDLTRTGLNLCDGGQTAYLTNTSNTITIHGAGRVPVAGTYTATIHYYRQSTATCQGPFTCTNASVTISGSDINILVGGCVALPANFSSQGIVRINLTNGPGGASYFFHIYGGACILPLPIHVSAFDVQRVQLNGQYAIKVTWTADIEDNASHVIIERNSVAGAYEFDFEIGRVDVDHSSSPPHSYQFIDWYPLNGTNWYRLKLVDQDGSVEYINPKSESCSGCNYAAPFIDCSGIGINGPSQLCEQETYSVSSSLFYSKYAWSVDNYNAYYPNSPNAPSQPSILLMAAGDGPTNLSVSMSRCSPATRTKTKYINVGQLFDAYISNYWVGSSPVPLILHNEGANYQPEGQIEMDVWTPWGVPSNMNFEIGDAVNWQWNPSAQRLTVYMTPNQYAVFRLDLETVCGPRSYMFDIACTNMLSYYSLSPNPASSQLNVYVDDRKLNKMKLKRSLNQNIQQLIISDRSGNTVFQQRYPVNTSNVAVNIAAFKTDMYTIRIFDGKKWTTMKFIKQ